MPEDRNIFSRVMERHQRNKAANGKILSYLSQTYRYPESFDNLLKTNPGWLAYVDRAQTEADRIDRYAKAKERLSAITAADPVTVPPPDR